MLGSSTRQVNVYGRKGRTRIVHEAQNWDDENGPSTPPRKSVSQYSPSQAPAPSRGLFAGLDLRSTWGSWMNSPREAFQSKVATPLRQWAGGKGVAAQASTTTTRTPLQPKPTNIPTDLNTTFEDMKIEDKGLSMLLRRTSQAYPLEFAQVIRDLAHGSFEKVGEASYSEVYRCKSASNTESIVKVIPLDTGALAHGIALSSIENVEREIAMVSALSQASHPFARHFVQLQKAYVVRGTYPDQLLHAWDAFKVAEGTRSENARPSVLPSSQLYSLIVMNNAGTELENTPLFSWVERAAVFWQVACAVAHAEHDSSFEHRDLHMGNILVRRIENNFYDGDDQEVEKGLWQRYSPSRTNIHATIIDYSLSRMDLEGGVVAYDFADASLFDGYGDTQYDVYRKMRSLVSEDWMGHAPMTNVLWLQFVLHKLLNEHAPPVDDNGDLGADTAESQAYNLLVHAEHVAHDALEREQRHVPQRRVSTRSKRRSIQRAQDAWKVLPDARGPSITSAWTWMQTMCKHMEPVPADTTGYA